MICFTKETREFLRKKMGFGANGGFDFTRELKEKYEEKRGGLGSTVDLILYRNWIRTKWSGTQGSV